MYKKVSVAIAMTLVMATLLTVSWSALQRSQAQTNGNLEGAILAIHNAERAAVGNSPLQWSNSLAADAQSCAQQLVSAGYGAGDILPHCSTGENLAWGTPGYFTAQQGAQRWANEKG